MGFYPQMPINMSIQMRFLHKRFPTNFARIRLFPIMSINVIDQKSLTGPAKITSRSRALVWQFRAIFCTRFLRWEQFSEKSWQSWQSWFNLGCVDR
eukprot:TRINITY_DN16211_c0_g1_i1.p1 TRINITY_DN16211_c0_g1~~TRINITY_DN16211_c0_g1_i1.p1  ORF type:complete len:96 (+),score=4.33 TRINITY_DN16211_c0_g1_i1:172-459(+)